LLRLREKFRQLDSEKTTRNRVCATVIFLFRLELSQKEEEAENVVFVPLALLSVIKV
jgi:hypothetical protein